MPYNNNKKTQQIGFQEHGFFLLKWFEIHVKKYILLYKGSITDREIGIPRQLYNKKSDY